MGFNVCAIKMSINQARDYLVALNSNSPIDNNPQMIYIHTQYGICEAIETIKMPKINKAASSNGILTELLKAETGSPVVIILPHIVTY